MKELDGIMDFNTVLKTQKETQKKMEEIFLKDVEEATKKEITNLLLTQETSFFVSVDISCDASVYANAIETYMDEMYIRGWDVRLIDNEDGMISFFVRGQSMFKSESL